MNTKHALALLIVVASALAARADETEVLFDGAGIGGWDTARDQQRLEREFAVSELTAVPAPPALAWRFVSKGVSFNDLFLKKPVERPFRQVRVLVRNTGEAVEFGAKVRDANGAEWTAPAVPLPSSGDWRWVEFPRDAWRVASWSRDADGKLDFPLACFTIIAFGVKPGLEYQLHVQRIEILRPDPPVVTVHAIQVPERWVAGQTIQATIAFSLDKPCTEDDARLVLRSGRETLADFPLPLPASLSKLAAGQRVDLDRIALCVPEYTWGGKATLELKLGEARVQFEPATTDRIPDPWVVLETSGDCHDQIEPSAPRVRVTCSVRLPVSGLRQIRVPDSRLGAVQSGGRPISGSEQHGDGLEANQGRPDDRGQDRHPHRLAPACDHPGAGGDLDVSLRAKRR
jgi:hypothetical protein